MKLFYAPQSPFARKVRVIAHELGLQDRIELIYTQVIPTAKNAAFAASHTPLRKVPTLELETGEVLIDSAVICDYLDQTFGKGDFFPTDPTERWRVLSDHAMANGMTDAAISIRYEESLRPKPQQWAAWSADQWDKINAILDHFDAKILQAGLLRIDAVALASGIGYIDFRFGTEWRTGRNTLSAWFDQLMTRESFAATMPHDP